MAFAGEDDRDLGLGADLYERGDSGDDVAEGSVVVVLSCQVAAFFKD